jgi:crossover junction endodeoxyribonuclease RuvC
MIILGIDPGIERLGYAFTEVKSNSLQALSYGLISTSKEEKKPRRLHQIYEDIKSLIEKHHPSCLCVETLIFAKNVKTALVVSEVRGVILLLSAQFELPLLEFTPLQVKMSLTGYGRSSKSQIQSAVKLILCLPEIPKPDDISDAIAIAICGGNTMRFQQKINKDIGAVN